MRNLKKIVRWKWYQFLVLLLVSVHPCSCFFPPERFLQLVEDENPRGNFVISNPEKLNEPEEFVHSKIYSAFEEYNKELKEYNHMGALIAWNISTNMTPEILALNQKFVIEKNIWNNHWCGELLKVYHDPQFGHFEYAWDISHLRQLYLICRGPRFSSYQLSQIQALLSGLQKLYNKEVCIPSLGKCMRMEPDLNRFMERTRSEPLLREAWISWHQTIGGEVKPLYAGLIRMLNQGAKQAGFRDMGQCWREELEMHEDIRELATKLYSDVKYLYSLLHAYVRYMLENYYGLKFQDGFIPAHLLGNMWAQKWDSLIDIVWKDDDSMTTPKGNSLPSSTFSLVEELLPSRNATVMDMVKSAESFYVSMGLPKLPKLFWENSYFQDEGKENGRVEANSRNCHGSAANMFGNGDYRMMMCAQVNDEDLVILHHEIGHIMYFMAYSKLPTVFQEGANSAFHESVGDSVTYDLLHSAKEEGINMKSLLRTGLAKLPQIGFGLIMDLWRWELFENPSKVQQWNDLWWEMNENFLGITRPHPDYNRNGESLDAAGKFHIVDNIPYIRYFFASFLQLQFYEAMCKASMGIEKFEDEQASKDFLLHCRIRGSKDAGKLLWKMMEQGASKHWTEILEDMTGTSRVESKALLKYFEPLKVWLEKEVVRLNISNVGW